IGPAGPVRLVTGTVQNNTLYFLSKTMELYAVSLDGRVQWHTPVQRKIETLRVDGGRVYAASTDTGELFVLDAASGAITASTKIAPKNLMIAYAGPDAVVSYSEKSVYGIDPLTGVQRWEYPVAFTSKEVMYFKGVVIARTSSTQLAVLEAETG